MTRRIPPGIHYCHGHQYATGPSKAVVKEEFEIFDFFLTNKKKRLIQEQKEQERKDRTNRLCKRMGFIEKLLPDTIPLTEEQFKTFVEQTIATDHSRRVLDGLTAQNAATAPAQGAGTVGKHPARRQNRPHSAGGRRRRERGARVTGLRDEAGEGCYTSLGLVGRYCAAVLSIDEGICQGCAKAFLKSSYIPNVIFKISSKSSYVSMTGFFIR